jgi:hypothetical protein
MRSLLVIALMVSSASANDIDGHVLDPSGNDAGGSLVRIVGDRFVVYAWTDAAGRFVVKNLPDESYRLVLERPELYMVPIGPPLTLTVVHGPIPDWHYRECHIFEHPWPQLAIGAPVRNHGFVDSTSTTQGIVLTSPGRLSH